MLESGLYPQLPGFSDQASWMVEPEAVLRVGRLWISFLLGWGGKMGFIASTVDPGLTSGRTANWAPCPDRATGSDQQMGKSADWDLSLGCRCCKLEHVYQNLGAVCCKLCPSSPSLSIPSGRAPKISLVIPRKWDLLWPPYQCPEILGKLHVHLGLSFPLEKCRLSVPPSDAVLAWGRGDVVGV